MTANLVSAGQFWVDHLFSDRRFSKGIGFIRDIKSFQQPVFSEAEVGALMPPLQTGHRAPMLATYREHRWSVSAHVRQPTADHRNSVDRLDCGTDGAYQREHDPSALWDVDQ